MRVLSVFMFVKVMSVICKSKVVCEVWFNIFVTYITDSEFRIALFVDVGVELAKPCYMLIRFHWSLITATTNVNQNKGVV